MIRIRLYSGYESKEYDKCMDDFSDITYVVSIIVIPIKFNFDIA